MSVPLPSKSRPLLRSYVRAPWTAKARNSVALRRYCAKHGHLTPNFSVREMADTRTGSLPMWARPAARRHCFNLELLKHRLGDVAIKIDGPFRTKQHNAEIHGARDSRHTHGDATDHFSGTCDAIVRASPRVSSKAQLVAVAEQIFSGVGNEGSGTLHLDSRPGPWVRFVTWVGIR